MLHLNSRNRDSVIGIRIRLRDGRSGARFTAGYLRFFNRGYMAEAWSWPHQHLMRRLRMSTAVPLLPLCTLFTLLNPLTPNDLYMSRTAPLTFKRCILYIYSTNVGTEYFKHALYSPLFSIKNAVCFIMLTCLVPVLFTFYIQSVLKLKKNYSGAKGLILTYVNNLTISST